MLSHIFETHSHYDAEQFDGIREQLIESLFERNIAGLIHAATDIKSSEFGIETAKKYERFYTSVGFHPEYASEVPENAIEVLKELAKKDKVVAIGEIGLDYHYEGYDREAQIELFRAQLELANELNLPVIVHSRNATEDTLEILRELRPRGVMHCFSGSAETAKELIEMGFYISLTGVLTFKNAKKASKVMEALPLDRFMLETDCPYMAPEPHRGELCDSSMIRFTAQKAAEIKGISLEQMLMATEENAKRFFGIK